MRQLLATEDGAVDEIGIYASGGVEHVWHYGGEKSLIEEALRYKEQGYDAFKFRTGTDWERSGMTFDAYVPILRRLREAVGPDFRLMHEGIGTLLGSLEAVITEFAPVLEELGFYWFEEAFGGTSSEHIDLFVELNEAMPTVMVSGGERFLERFESQVWLDRGALDIIQTDCNVAGLTENWYIARMAHLRGKLAIPHNWHGGGTTMANAHYVARHPQPRLLRAEPDPQPAEGGDLQGAPDRGERGHEAAGQAGLRGRADRRRREEIPLRTGVVQQAERAPPGVGEGLLGASPFGYEASRFRFILPCG